jgi:hypothetical protein
MAVLAAGAGASTAFAQEIPMRFAPLFPCAAGAALALICASALAAPDQAIPSPLDAASAAPLRHTPLPETAPPAPATGDWRAANAGVAAPANGHGHHASPPDGADAKPVSPDHRSHDNGEHGIHHHHHSHPGGHR